MTVSWYSFFSAVILYSAVLAAVLILRRSSGFLKRHGISSLLFLTALAVVRLILPIDFASVYILKSWTVMPAIHDLFRSYPWTAVFLLGLWGCGTAVVILRDIFSLVWAYKICKNYRIVKSERVQQIAENLRVKCPVQVSPDVRVPYVMGLFHHTIYLPARRLSGSEIELVLRHEMQHIRSHDAWIKLLFGLLSAFLWWNPIVCLFRRELDTILELRCDTEVTASMDRAGKEQYLSMLLNAVRHLTVPEPVQVWSAAVRSGNVLRQRFTMVLERRNTSRMGIAAKCCLCAVFLSSYTIIFQPAGLPPVERNEYLSVSPSGIPAEFLDTSGINRDTSFILESDGCYYLIVDGKKYWELRHADCCAEFLSELQVKAETEIFPQNQDFVWKYRSDNGIKRLWSVTSRRWVTDWMPA